MNIVKKHPFILLVSINILVYFPVIFAAKTVNPDAQIIFEHLTSIKGLFDYLF
jgi:hypothetical protein